MRTTRQIPSAAARPGAQLSGGPTGLTLLAVLLALPALLTAPGLPGGPGAAAQEPEGVRVVQDELPDAVVRDLAEFLNDPATLTFAGPSRIPAGSRVDGDVGVLGGTLTLGGEVTGRVVVVNGDLELLPGARVGGDVTVVDGTVSGAEGAEVRGGVTLYRGRFDYIRRGGQIVPRRRADEEARLARFTSPFGPGRTRFTVRAGTSYNRTEGLPVLFGPVLATAGSNPLNVELLGIWRTGRGFDSDELGWQLRAEQALGGHREIFTGLDFHSRVQPIERWGLSDLETSLATFLFHRDQRDHWEVEGWSGWLRWDPAGSPLSLRLTYRDEEHAFAPITGPWSLQDNDDPWRPQPAVAEGTLRTVTVDLGLDTRNSVDDPSAGWWLRTEATMGIGGELERPALAEEQPGADRPIPAAPVSTSFTSGLADLRSYLRVTPAVVLGVRALAGGSIDGEPLPPQFQRAIGGEGSLPGYPLFAGDCGARSRVLSGPIRDGGEGADRDVFPRYGCDRMALVQLELRGHFFRDWTLGPDAADEEGRWTPRVDLSPGWSLFADVGRGWRLGGEADPALAGGDTRTLIDVGGGLLLGDLGLYVAVPLRGGSDVNVFLRLGRRF